MSRKQSIQIMKTTKSQNQSWKSRKLFIWQEKNTNMTQYHKEYVTVRFFVVGRLLERRWAHRLRKGDP